MKTYNQFLKEKVKSIEALWTGSETLQPGDCISWDGNDEFGDPLARGIYLYRISVSTGINTSQPIIGESKFEKLVILK